MSGLSPRMLGHRRQGSPVCLVVCKLSCVLPAAAQGVSMLMDLPFVTSTDSYLRTLDNESVWARGLPAAVISVAAPSLTLAAVPALPQVSLQVV